MIPRLKADLRFSDLSALFSGPSGQNALQAFEDRFARLAGTKFAIAFPYGRTAQMAMLQALNTSRKEVICPSYTCVVVAHALVKAGLTPVFVDSRDEDFNMDWDCVNEATNEKTAAVIATSIFGHPVCQASVKNFESRHPDIPILMDCAHSFFAGGAHKWGLGAYFGLNISKLMTSIFGGMVTTDNADYAHRIRDLRDDMVTPGGLAKEFQRACYFVGVLVAFNSTVYGFVNWLERCGFLDRFVKYYDEARIDLPQDAFVMMGTLQARVGLRQCDRYAAIVAHRRRLAEIYHSNLSEHTELLLPPIDPGMTVSHFVIRTADAIGITAACRAHGVQLGRLIDYDVATMPTYKMNKCLGKGNSVRYPGQVINLPVHVGVTEKDARRICNVIKAYLHTDASGLHHSSTTS